MRTQFLFRKADRLYKVVQLLVLQGGNTYALPYLLDHGMISVCSGCGILIQVFVIGTFQFQYGFTSRQVEVAA